MHLVYDSRLVSQSNSGLGRYTATLLITLLKLIDRKRHRLSVIIPRGENAYQDQLKQFSGENNIHFFTSVCPALSLYQHFYISKQVNKLEPDLYFYPHFDAPLFVRGKYRFVVHDLFPIKVPGYTQRLPFLKNLYFKSLIYYHLKAAESCVCVSNTTKKDLVDLFGSAQVQKIKVAREASFFSPDLTIESKNTDKPYILYVGDRRPHKNIKRILDLFAALKKSDLYSGHLIIAGSDINYDFNVDDYIQNRNDVILKAAVSDSELAKLYRDTDALLLLSKYEGFGLTILEAAQFNKKMILSDGGSIGEIAPPWAYILPNHASLSVHLDQISKYIQQNLEINSVEYLEEYSWEKCVRETFPELF